MEIQGKMVVLTESYVGDKVKLYLKGYTYYKTPADTLSNYEVSKLISLSLDLDKAETADWYKFLASPIITIEALNLIIEEVANAVKSKLEDINPKEEDIQYPVKSHGITEVDGLIQQLQREGESLDVARQVIDNLTSVGIDPNKLVGYTARYNRTYKELGYDSISILKEGQEIHIVKGFTDEEAEKASVGELDNYTIGWAGELNHSTVGTCILTSLLYDSGYSPEQLGIE